MLARASVNIVFLLLARQKKQVSFALARASVCRYHTPTRQDYSAPKSNVDFKENIIKVGNSFADKVMNLSQLQQS